MKTITYKEWLKTTPNEKMGNSFYTETEVFRLGQDKSHKKFAEILKQNNINDFRINILNEDEKSVKFFKNLGFRVEAICFEDKSKDYYFVK